MLTQAIPEHHFLTATRCMAKLTGSWTGIEKSSIAEMNESEVGGSATNGDPLPPSEIGIGGG